jgi:2-oxoglutarate/2-oxoacid ferredoxin oxidoreductase subunit beta
MNKIKTDQIVTWCPGCPNFMILEAVKKTLEKFDTNRFAMTTDIGCNSKIFDYLNISGIYGLHGRGLSKAIGIKLGNPKLKTLTFVGDGGLYAEGISHLIHAFRYNADMNLFVHDNQSFSLTTGQPTPTSQKGLISKSKPMGEENSPLNPMKLALASGATFVARTNAKDIPHMVEVFTKAINHKGFSFVEIIQDCLIFNIEINDKDKLMYKIADCHNLTRAEKFASEWNYNRKAGRIPIGIIYQSKEPILAEKWPLLNEKLKR